MIISNEPGDVNGLLRLGCIRISRGILPERLMVPTEVPHGAAQPHRGAFPCAGDHWALGTIGRFGRVLLPHYSPRPANALLQPPFGVIDIEANQTIG
jgi:hypothetical protein